MGGSITGRIRYLPRGLSCFYRGPHPFLAAGENHQGVHTSQTVPGRKYRCLVEIKINHIDTQCLVDTGATSSAINSSFLHCFPNYRQFIKRRHPKNCVSVNGKQLRSSFTVVLPVSIGREMFKHEFEVIQGLIYPTLLGTDLLKSKGAKLDFTTNELQIGKAKASFDIPPWPKQNSQLVAIDDSILKPNSITLLRAEISGNDPRLKTDRPTHLLIGPLPSESLFDLSFLTSYSIIDPYMEEIIVEVMNPSAKPVHVCQGRPIASIEGENLEMSETGLARDLSKMPSDYSFLDNESDYHLQTLFDNPIVDGHTDTNLPFCSSSHVPIVSPYPVLANSLNCTSDGVELRKQNIKGFTPKGLLTREGLKRVHIDPAIAATDGEDEMTKNERENNTDENKTNTHRKEKETEKENEYVLRTDNTILGEEDLKELQRIIDKYSGIVAKHADDIGKTNLVYHYANLTSDTPICTPNYRTPPSPH